MQKGQLKGLIQINYLNLLSLQSKNLKLILVDESVFVEFVLCYGFHWWIFIFS